MTVSVQEPIIQHTANGATTVFAYNFLVLDSADFEVYLDDILQVSGFSISGIGVNAGGSVTFSTAPASGVVVTLLRAVDLKRETDYQNAGDFRADTVNPDFDRIWLAIQGLKAEIDRRALLFKITSVRDTDINRLPEPVSGQVLTWSNGQLINSPITSLASNLSFVNAAQIFVSVALMKADFDPDSSNFAATTGYRESAAGGAGLYSWDALSTATDDGFLVHAVTGYAVGRLLLMSEGGTFGFQQAGARFDGITDDTADIQKCLSLSGRKTLIAPPNKTAIFSDNLIFTDYTTIIGYGSVLKVKDNTALNIGNLIVSDATFEVGVRSIKIYGLEVDGNRYNRSTGTREAALIYTSCSYDVILDDVTVRNAVWEGVQTAGNLLFAGGLSQRVTHRNVRTINCYRNGQSLTGVKHFRGYDCSSDSTEGADPQAGFAIEADSINNPNIDCWYFNSSAEDNYGPGMYAANPWNIGCGAHHTYVKGNAIANDAFYKYGAVDYNTGFASTGGRFKFFGIIDGGGNTGGVTGAQTWDEETENFAKVIIDGATGNIVLSSNVASVSRTSAGNYRITFLDEAPTANYLITGGVNGDGVLHLVNNVSTSIVDVRTIDFTSVAADYGRVYVFVGVIRKS